MSYRSGGYLKETLAEAGYGLLSRTDGAALVINLETGVVEQYFARQHVAGYALVICGHEYGFCTTFPYKHLPVKAMEALKRYPELFTVAWLGRGRGIEGAR